MGKKVKHPEHENLERWLVSYADFITLLFATFTALYAIATAELSKRPDVSKAISQSFEQQSLMHGISSLFEGKSSSTDKSNVMVTETGKGDGVMGAHDSMTFTPGEVKAAEELVDELQETVAKLNEDIEAMNEAAQQAARDAAEAAGEQAPEFQPLLGVEVSAQERGIRVSFDSRLLFAPASAQLKPASVKLMDTVMRRLKSYAQQHQIHVEGHTDSEPLSTPLFPSNWELSTARASTVVRHLIRLGFSPQLLVAVGYADSRPVGDNKTSAGREKNRRIDIILYTRAEGNLNDPAQAIRREKSLIKAPGYHPPSKDIKQPAPEVPPPAPIIRDALIKSEGEG